mmetsp:Transcript_26156/g.25334  ORF Transcript_26156/g.25334 Transcript_26156/m.25334 type:complete len:138 (+) Transcript_26156:555-968(+)
MKKMKTNKGDEKKNSFMKDDLSPMMDLEIRDVKKQNIHKVMPMKLGDGYEKQDWDELNFTTGSVSQENPLNRSKDRHSFKQSRGTFSEYQSPNRLVGTPNEEDRAKARPSSTMSGLFYCQQKIQPNTDLKGRKKRSS